MKDKEIKDIIQSHIIDACEWLKMDASSIGIRIDNLDNMFLPYILSEAEDTICFKASFLEQYSNAKQYTPIRHATYCLVRQIWQKKNGAPVKACG